MRRICILIAVAAIATFAGCSVYNVLFGMFSSNYSSASPDNASRYAEMQSEVDRWAEHQRQSLISE
jgi:hypothetical protein